MEQNPIRIAHIMGKWLGGGVESVVMNYYRHIDRTKIQFDFICDEDSTNIPYDEIESLGGAELAAKLGCVSADHLMAASDEGIKMMAENNVVANILPATSFNLNKNYADCRKMIDMGAIVSLSSDYNPGSCPSENLQLVMQLGCLHLKMTPNEVLTAVTINAAYAIDRADKIGSIEVGKNADFVVFDARNVEYLMYHFGINHTKKVYKNGNLVVDNKVVVYDK